MHLFICRKIFQVSPQLLLQSTRDTRNFRTVHVCSEQSYKHVRYAGIFSPRHIDKCRQPPASHTQTHTHAQHTTHVRGRERDVPSRFGGCRQPIRTGGRAARCITWTAGRTVVYIDCCPHPMDCRRVNSFPACSVLFSLSLFLFFFFLLDRNWLFAWSCLYGIFSYKGKIWTADRS